jgi:hypothetical protein
MEVHIMSQTYAMPPRRIMHFRVETETVAESKTAGIGLMKVQLKIVK